MIALRSWILAWRKEVHVPAMPQEIVSLAFSPDTKLLAAQGGPGEWNLVVWSWEKAKQVAVIKASNQMSSPIHQVSPNLELERAGIMKRLTLSE